MIENKYIIIDDMPKHRYKLFDRETGKIMQTKKLTEEEARKFNAGFRIIKSSLEYIKIKS